MKEFKVLKFLDKFKVLFEKFGVDYEIMRKILQMKLVMDGRRIPTIMNKSNKNKEKEEENSFFKSLGLYAFFGLIIVVLIIPKTNLIFQMSCVFGILMFMIMTTLISDFSSVLLDIRDKNIIFSKPVNNKTINAAKFIHVFIYMFSLTIAFSGLALVVSLIRHGFIFFILFLFELILMDLFIIVLTAFLYLGILKFFDGEKLKDVINYIQIALSIVVSIGYQLIGRLFNIIDINIVFTPKWWQYFIIPMWFAAPFSCILENSRNTYYIIFSILAIAVPVIAILIYIKLVSSFERNLQKLNVNSGKTDKRKKKLFYKLSNVFCSNKQEQIFFRFTYYMIKNEREFKLKVYPSLGLAFIFPFLFIFMERGEGKGFSEWLSYMASTKYYLNIYFCALLLPTVVMMMKYSGKYKGAWIYKVMPIKEAASIFKGTLKAAIIKLIVPIYLFQSLIFIIIFGIKIVPDLVLVFINMMFFTIICFKSMRKSLPFSASFQSTQQSEGFIIIPLMILLAALAGIHYKCTFTNLGVYIYMAVMFIVDIFLWKKSFNISWKKVEKSYTV
ncbi:hypothetical protein [Clostridium ganghwense]|uniref:ABC transporter permease n=1 Tax=Clostridium ganghwense TaxID=312089 RepID=A0ABT4CJU5_9CLOT|nr:hypothetical protein [Clostridium ganghwense]MCY6369323.1 hypothetical protein [Clostridium ganghwense]